MFSGWSPDPCGAFSSLPANCIRCHHPGTNSSYRKLSPWRENPGGREGSIWLIGLFKMPGECFSPRAQPWLSVLSIPWRKVEKPAGAVFPLWFGRQMKFQWLKNSRSDCDPLERRGNSRATGCFQRCHTTQLMLNRRHGPRCPNTPLVTSFNEKHAKELGLGIREGIFTAQTDLFHIICGKSPCQQGLIFLWSALGSWDQRRQQHLLTHSRGWNEEL